MILMNFNAIQSSIIEHIIKDDAVYAQEDRLKIIGHGAYIASMLIELRNLLERYKCELILQNNPHLCKVQGKHFTFNYIFTNEYTISANLLVYISDVVNGKRKPLNKITLKFSDGIVMIYNNNGLIIEYEGRLLKGNNYKLPNYIIIPELQK